MKPLDAMFADTTKSAALPPVANKMLLGTAAMLLPKPSSEPAVMRVYNPEEEAELRKIKIQAMLAEFMSSDPVISTYDPEEVTEAYNQVAQLAPKAAAQPVVMRGLLRRFLQQQDALEPHEVEQITSIENSLGNIDTTKQLMEAAPAPTEKKPPVPMLPAAPKPLGPGA